MIKRLLRSLIAVGISTIAIAAAPLSADSINLSTPTGDGIYATGGWSATGGAGFAITSTYTTNPDGTIHYAYLITADPAPTELSKGLSHVIIEVSRNVPLSDIIIPGTFSAQAGTGSSLHAVTLEIDGAAPKEYTGGPSNPGLNTTILYGIKWDIPADEAGKTLSIEFDSLRMPKLGSFYAKDGKVRSGGSNVDVYAYNTGLALNDRDLLTDKNAIWVPDSQAVTVVPEPSTYAALGSLLALSLILARRRVRQAT